MGWKTTYEQRSWPMELPKWGLFGLWSCRNGIYYISVLQDGDKPSGINKKIGELSSPRQRTSPRTSKHDWEMKKSRRSCLQGVGLNISAEPHDISKSLPRRIHRRVEFLPISFLHTCSSRLFNRFDLKHCIYNFSDIVTSR